MMGEGKGGGGRREEEEEGGDAVALAVNDGMCDGDGE
jgi:hypothetical protein